MCKCVGDRNLRVQVEQLLPLVTSCYELPVPSLLPVAASCHQLLRSEQLLPAPPGATRCCQLLRSYQFLAGVAIDVAYHLLRSSNCDELPVATCCYQLLPVAASYQCQVVTRRDTCCQLLCELPATKVFEVVATYQWLQFVASCCGVPVATSYQLLRGTSASCYQLLLIVTLGWPIPSPAGTCIALRSPLAVPTSLHMRLHANPLTKIVV